ncbi:MAG: DUF1919 domain-containing protein [Clostridia bacterium]|nr:DUF1919 domain-containing protein [Clostridia bacterium]
MPKISVIMPAYNAEKYIGEAIDSILNQTFTDFEFIILDDGSVDHTAELVAGYSDPRIRFLQNERNLGVAETLNRGLQLAAGEYVARMDADDIAMPTRFEKQIAYMEEHPDVAVLGTGIEVFGAKRHTTVFSQSYEELKIDLLFACCFAHPTVMMRTELLRNGGYAYDPSFNRMEDYDLWDRISERYSIASIPDVLLRYRTHPLQVTHKKTPEDVRQIREIKKRQLARLGIETAGEGAECFFGCCDGSFSPTKENVLLLNQFFQTLRRSNAERRVYRVSLLKKHLKSVSANLLDKLPLSEAIALSGRCGVCGIPYAAKRSVRGLFSRVRGKRQQKRRQARLKTKDFSILCNNCWGGFLYQFFGLPYRTPTVGLFFLGRDFVKFAADFERYLAQELVFIPWESSAYYDFLKDETPYPVAKLDDIEIYFMHYHSEEEAREKWNRRKERINRDKLLFKLSEREGCSREDVERFVALPLKNKICFSYDRVEGAIRVPELEGFVGDETPLVEPYYDKFELLNGIR